MLIPHLHKALPLPASIPQVPTSNETFKFLTMIYNTSLDKTAKFTTIGITIMFALMIGLQVSIIGDSGNVVPILTIITIFFSYFMVFAFRPISYELTDTKLIIHRLLKNVVIDRDKIKSAEFVDKEKLSFLLRLFAVGGLFGYFGKFSNNEFGRMSLYATRRDKNILLQTIDNKKFILTPNDTEKFLAEFNK